MRAAVLGATGFIGRALTPVLAQQGGVVAISRHGTEPQLPGVKAIAADAEARRARVEMDPPAPYGRTTGRVVPGDVFRPRVPRSTRVAEQRGARLAVIVQADELPTLSNVLVAPASQSAPPRSFRPAIEVASQATRMLLEQTTAVTPDRPGHSLGHLSPGELRDVDAALTRALGI